MATIKVIDVISRVEAILQDTNIRWPRVELQKWLNESYLSIVLLRPDANAVCATFTCAAGTKQELTASSGGFPSALRLLDITRNVLSSSNKKVVRVVARSVLDDQRPSWHSETESANIQHYTYDPRHPKQFYVYPPATSTAELEVIYADAPGSHALSESDLDPDGSNTEVIKLDDIYLSPITDWILYRAYSKDAEYGANEQRAASSFQTFNAAIGTKTQVDAAVTPNPASTVT
jgi:hypothetical protein